MLVVKKQLKKFLGLVSVGVILLGVVIGVILKDKNDSKAKSAQSNNDSKTQALLQDSNTKVNQPKTICRDFFEENEKDAILKGYSEKDIVDCSFIGCGGIF